MAWRKPANLNEWLGIVVRHKKKFFFPAMLVMTGVIWASQWMPREYGADAKFQRRSDTSMQATGDNPIGDAYSKIRVLMHYNFKGRPAIEQLITDLKLKEGMPHTPEGQLTTDGLMSYNDLINQLSGAINVGNTVASDQIDLISVSFSHKDPVLVPKVVNKLVENYMNKVRSEMDDTLLDQKKFFDTEVARYRRKVSELESAKLRFQLNNKGLNPEDPIFVYNKFNEVKTKKEEKKAELEKAKSSLESLVKWEKDQPEFKENRTTEENEQLKEMKEKLKSLKQYLDVNRFELRRTDAHPAVKDLIRRIAETNKEIAEFEGSDKVNVEEVPNTEKIAAKKEIAVKAGEFVAMEKSLDELTADVDRYEELNRNFFNVRNDYLKINRELADSADQLKYWEDNLRRTQMALTLAVGDRGMRLSFVQRTPEQITKPSSPTLFKILGFAVVAGLATGALMIILAELLDHSYRSVEQAIDEIKLPVLGAINEIVSPAAAMRRKILGWGVFPAVTVILALVFGLTFYVTYLSLEQPHKFKALKDGPVNFIKAQFGA